MVKDVRPKEGFIFFKMGEIILIRMIQKRGKMNDV